MRRDVDLLEVTTNKLIEAFNFSKHTKIHMVRDNYKDLYKKKNKYITSEEVEKRMRMLMIMEKS